MTNNQKTYYIDVFLGKYLWYRKLRKGHWYKHEFTRDAGEIRLPIGDTWWARHGELNRYSKVIETESYLKKG